MSKLKLLSEDTELDVTEVSFTFEYDTPLTAQSVEANAYTYPAELPASERNQTFFNHIHLPESRQKFKEWACRVQFADDLLIGKLLLLKADNRKYTVSIIRNVWTQAILDQNIRNVDYEGLRTGITDMPAHALAMANANSDTEDYTFFPISNADFYNGSTNADYQGTVNDFVRATGVFVGTTLLSSGPNVYTNYSAFVPFPYLVYILKRIAHSFGKILRGSFIADADIKQAVIYNTFALDEFRTVSGDTANFYSTTINIQNHLPDLFVKEFLDRLMIAFNIAIYLTDTEMVMEWKDDKLNNPEADDWTDISERNPYVEPFIQNAPTGYTFKTTDDTTEVNMKTFLENTLAEGQIKGVLNSFLSLPVPSPEGTIYFLIDEYRCVKAKASGLFDLVNENGQNLNYAGTFTTGTGAKEISIDIGTLKMVKTANVLTPKALQQGNSKEYDLMQEGKENPYEFKLLFARGFQNDNIAQPYPLGTPDVWAFDSATIGPVGNRSMFFWGQYGLYEKSHKKWLNFINNAKAVNFVLALDATRLGRLNLTDKIRIDRANYFFEKITVSVSTKGIRKATARAIKL